ncbi:tetratricopeptide repeat protein [Nocardia sp. alder85J]|uniref:tetratricopeptide repeat protein n=1 Tax=Nocardia sp. alder85J TaxID=2862949 RepID=UPI001CD39C3A|nr:tetratricopeptide repeat protein [Nocardia sp. alder85J]MCX4094474.1 tetratricopeptide repeat protein [Nocardia sp. alder85J]
MTGPTATSSLAQPDSRVPGFLGRILYPGGVPAGTCFQAATGVLVTAAHVLRDVDAGYPGAVVRVDALAGGLAVFEAAVARVDEIHDLAVLTAATALTSSVAGWAATDVIELGTATVITGVSEVPDPHHDYRYLDAAGIWAGGTTRDEQVPLGRLKAESVMKGMSGGPVRRRSDDYVIGVVSQRYNSADGWARDSVLIARIEDLHPLLEGITAIEVTGPPPLTAAVDLVLTVTETRVRLHGGGIDVDAGHQGVRPGLAAAVTDVHRERTRRATTSITRTSVEQQAIEPATGTVSLRRAGILAAESFLPPPITDALTNVLTRAVQAYVPVRIGIEPGPFPMVPWEALPDPVSSTPWALHPLITVYRRVAAGPVRAIAGPLRILVAIAAPTESGGPVLDYEHELRNVLKAVKGARYGDAQVRIVEFATTDAIRTELEQASAHVLHLSGHGSPGHLILETDSGAARPVTARQLLEEAIPAGLMPPVISLAACHTDVAAEAGASSFAADLLAHGASVVIATETTVTDRYATALFARVYQDLAHQPVPDVVAAVTAARRTIHRQWSTSPSPRDTLLAGLDEWSVVTVLAAQPTVTVYDPAVRDTAGNPAPAVAGPVVSGLVQRDTGDFVGRRRELRTLPAVLAGNRYAGIVLHGLGGIGKTTLATQLLHRQQHSPLVVVATGELNPDTLLAAIAARVSRFHTIETGTVPDPRVPAALQYVTRVDQPWTERLAVLREYVFDVLPILVVLDNFEDNLTPGTHTITDASLADLLAAWVTDPGRSRLLVTCRYPLSLPGQAHGRLLAQVVGPMTQAETFKLIWSLPELDRLDDAELERVWRLVGGHPRSLEYLDALLGNKIARYRDITARLTTALAAHPATQPALTSTTLDVAVATAVTLIADDILLTDLFDQLTPAAQQLLIGAAVYREPIDHTGLLYQIGVDDPTAEWIPDRQQAGERITTILTGHGIDPTAGDFHLDRLPPDVLTDITPDLDLLTADPRPPVSTDADLPALVDELWSHSLISIDPGRQRVFVHRSTATALTAILTHRGRAGEHATAHTRAARYWTWRVDVWPQDLDADLHDRLEARHHHLAAGDIPAAITITEAICTRLDTIGAWDHETILIHHTLTQLPPESPDRAPWYHQLGILAQARGDYGEADRRYQQALTIFEELGDRVGMASSYGQLGILAQARGDYAEAERRYQQALTLLEELGDRARMATSYHQLGILAQRRGDYPEAERRYQQSLTIEEELGNRVGMASSYGQLGILAQDRGDYPEAERRYQQALTIFEELGNRAGTATGYHQLGRLAQARGDYAEAERRYQQSLTINEELGNRAGTASSYHQLGILAQERGDYPEAERRYQQSLTIKEELGNRAGTANSYGQLGTLARDRGDYPEAERRYQQALTILEELGNRAGMASSYHQLGTLARDRGDYPEAERRYQQALTINEELGNRAGTATSYSAMGELAGQQGQLTDAVHFHLQALVLRLEIGVPQAANNIRALRRLRQRMNPQLFRTAVSEKLSDDDSQRLATLLDSVPEE